MDNVITFEIHDLPLRVNQLIQKSAWKIRLGEKRKWLNLIRAAVHGKIPSQPFPKAHLTLTRYSSRRPDYDGLVGSFKIVIDALVANDIILDDAWANIGMPDFLWEQAPINQGKIIVSIKELV